MQPHFFEFQILWPPTLHPFISVVLWSLSYLCAPRASPILCAPNRVHSLLRKTFSPSFVLSPWMMSPPTQSLRPERFFNSFLSWKPCFQFITTSSILLIFFPLQPHCHGFNPGCHTFLLGLLQEFSHGSGFSSCPVPQHSWKSDSKTNIRSHSSPIVNPPLVGSGCISVEG